MHTPFEKCDPGLGQTAPFGIGFGDNPFHHRRRVHREMHEQLRAQICAQADAGDSPFGFGPRGFGPRFGPGAGFGFGPGGPRGRRGGGRTRGRRGDVRSAILVLLTERAMHGYEMIQEIAERSNGLWKPSPGSVYPTLQLLVDENLIAATESDGSKKLFELTSDGRDAAEKIPTPPWDEITEDADPGQLNLRTAMGQLFGAVGQSAHAASEDQQQRIVEILNSARRDIYQILGEA